jgi:hypothetical protein
MAELTESPAHGDGKKSFARPGFAEDQQILQVVEKAELAEFFDLGLGEVLMKRKVDVLQIGAETKARLGHEDLGGSVLAFKQFFFEDQPQKLQRMELLSERFGGSALTRLMDAK